MSGFQVEVLERISGLFLMTRNLRKDIDAHFTLDFASVGAQVTLSESKYMGSELKTATGVVVGDRVDASNHDGDAWFDRRRVEWTIGSRTFVESARAVCLQVHDGDSCYSIPPRSDNCELCCDVCRTSTHPCRNDGCTRSERILAPGSKRLRKKPKLLGPTDTPRYRKRKK